MSEFQKIVIGILGMTHPEVQQLRLRFSEQDDSGTGKSCGADGPQPGALLRAARAAKFALAAMLAGARAIPLGDNGCLTRELGAYGARLQMH
jgi:hypothetical protein